MTIPINRTITRKGTGFDRKTWRGYEKGGWSETGEDWHARVLPKHFTTAGAGEYGYTPRKRSYAIGKAKRFGHTRPLVKHGDLEREVKRWRDVRATAKGARVVLHGPKHLHAYRKDLSEIDKAAELRAISVDDANREAHVLDNALQREIDANQTEEVISGK